MRSTTVKIAIAGALAALALAACSSSDKSGSSAATTPATEATTTTAASGSTGSGGAAAVVKLADSKFGKILVDSSGMTLYVDENDKPGAPACTGACLQAWPPLEAAGAITVGPGLSVAKYSVVDAADGTKQIAVNGSPLYTWMGDKKPGDVTGQDVNGFYVVQANGEKYEG
jgi:predicted lipoprotein with Yx(FWY)xxD motif